VLDTVVASGVPYVAVRGRSVRAKGCIGSIPWSFAPAVAEFTRRCADRNVRRVAVVGQNTVDVATAVRQISAAGIEPVRLVTDVDDGFARPEAVSRGAMSTFARLLESRERLPEVFLFLDDWVCSGALLAILEAGLSVPRDMKIVTLSNKGLGPVYSKPLTRLEIDHDAYSSTIAKAILGYLEGKPFPRGLALSPYYVEGETF
jgi:DNA-binding LacI/PurR family transcriptional regulator